MKKQRKHYTPEEKVAILRRHLLEKEPISKLCDEMGLQPTVFYRWQKEFFENGSAAFEPKRLSNHSAEQERIAYLEKKIQTKDEVLAELMAEDVAPKKHLGNSDRRLGSARHAGPDRGFRAALVGENRDQRRALHRVARHHREQVLRLARTLRQGERAQRLGSPAIVGFHLKNPLEGYRRLAFMMLDADVVAVSPSSVWRVLSQSGLLSKWNGEPSKKGTGFAQPLVAHEHWHIDVSYLNIGGTFYYLCSILDGFSRYIVNWDIRESMTEADIEIILQGAREKYPEPRPRIISDNGPQFIAKDFKEFIRISGMTHVRTSPFYPQSNGKIERWHKSLKEECIRPGTPLSLDDARRLVHGYVERYNNIRLNSATGYITPKDMLAGRQQEIHAERDWKLEQARKQRQIRRQQTA